ncbi:MAG TPA: DUF4157 domain-containing protein, partial [Burkholderiales bacterium]|nr:DUF4157 domain-containing protein [Burkholderiales bacterium]
LTPVPSPGGRGVYHGEFQQAAIDDGERPIRLSRAAAPASAGHSVPSVVHDTLQSPGRPLDTATRGFFEPRLGHDLGNVRVHTDEQAAYSANSIDALAYTVGSHIAFDAGRYAPTTTAGKRLLAHELAHVVQQSRMGGVTNGTIQRQAHAPGASSRLHAPAPASDWPRQYIALICEIISDIQAAVENGRIWDFEDEIRLGGDEMVGRAGLPAGQPQLIEQRLSFLRNTITTLHAFAASVQAGTERLIGPATRDNIVNMWWVQPRATPEFREGAVPLDDMSRWTVPLGSEPRSRRDPRPVRIYPNDRGYILNPPNPTPRILQPRPFPTWWIEPCGASEMTSSETGTTSHSPRLCQQQGRVTGRNVMLTSQGWRLITSGGTYFGPRETTQEERRDARGLLFVCHNERRIDRSW